MPRCPACNGYFEKGTFCPKDGSALIDDGEQPDSMLGQVVDGRYRLKLLLGRGGMGEVFAAEHVRITKKVAIKFLHPDICASQEAVARFQQEAQAASSIGHENIVTIDDFGVLEDGRGYLCMEFLEGQSLSEAMVAPEGMDPARSLRIMIQICDGLAAAHAKGIVHRDMKPENCFLTRRPDGSELVKILDFGIAKSIGAGEKNLTKTGAIFGTPHYMSPEQALGDHSKLDHRADIYAVGIMMFELFTGEVPFKAESFMGILSHHITTQPPVPSSISSSRQISEAVDRLILKAIAKEPEDRFVDMTHMRNELASVLASIGGAEGTAQGVAPGPALAGTLPAQPPQVSGDLAGSGSVPRQPGSVIPQQKRGKLAGLVLAVIVALVLLGGAGWFMLAGGDSGRDKEQGAKRAPAPASGDETAPTPPPTKAAATTTPNVSPDPPEERTAEAVPDATPEKSPGPRKPAAPVSKRPAKSARKPWLGKHPPLSGIDKGVGVSDLLESCQLHLDGGNLHWAEAACVVGVRKAKAKADRRLHKLFYRLGRVYERRGRKGDAVAAYNESLALKPGYSAAESRLKRLGGK